MKKFKLLSLVLTLLMVFSCVGITFASADPAIDSPEPPVVEDPVDPDVSEPDYSEPDTEYSEPDTEYSEPDTEYSEPDNTESDDTDSDYDDDYDYPTEYEEEPDTYSEYESPAPIYTPGEQDYEKQEWQSLSLSISESTNKGGPGSFAQMKQDRSNKDKTNPVWIIMCVVFWCLSLAAVTFAVLYKTKATRKPSHVYNTGRNTSTAGRSSDYSRRTSSSSSRSSSFRYEKKYSDDDYNDGF